MPGFAPAIKSHSAVYAQMVNNNIDTRQRPKTKSSRLWHTLCFAEFIVCESITCAVERRANERDEFTTASSYESQSNRYILILREAAPK